jgi:hypothetical protein
VTARRVRRRSVRYIGAFVLFWSVALLEDAYVVAKQREAGWTRDGVPIAVVPPLWMRLLRSSVFFAQGAINTLAYMANKGHLVRPLLHRGLRFLCPCACCGALLQPWDAVLSSGHQGGGDGGAEGERTRLTAPVAAAEVGSRGGDFAAGRGRSYGTGLGAGSAGRYQTLGAAPAGSGGDTAVPVGTPGGVHTRSHAATADAGPFAAGHWTDAAPTAAADATVARRGAAAGPAPDPWAPLDPVSPASLPSQVPSEAPSSASSSLGGGMDSRRASCFSNTTGGSSGPAPPALARRPPHIHREPMGGAREEGARRTVRQQGEVSRSSGIRNPRQDQAYGQTEPSETFASGSGAYASTPPAASAPVEALERTQIGFAAFSEGQSGFQFTSASSNSDQRRTAYDGDNGDNDDDVNRSYPETGHLPDRKSQRTYTVFSDNSDLTSSSEYGPEEMDFGTVAVEDTFINGHQSFSTSAHPLDYSFGNDRRESSLASPDTSMHQDIADFVEADRYEVSSITSDQS